MSYFYYYFEMQRIKGITPYDKFNDFFFFNRMFNEFNLCVSTCSKEKKKLMCKQWNFVIFLIPVKNSNIPPGIDVLYCTIIFVNLFCSSTWAICCPPHCHYQSLFFLSQSGNTHDSTLFLFFSFFKRKHSTYLRETKSKMNF